MPKDDVQVEDAISIVANDLTTTTGGSIPPGTPASHETVAAAHAYQIKPTLEDKFKANPVKEIIRDTFESILVGKNYDSDSARRWTVNIADEVNKKVKELKMRRYKHIVQVVVGESKGAGVKCGVRCVWDSETDGYTSETFTNETIFCVVVVFAVYLY